MDHTPSASQRGYVRWGLPRSLDRRNPVAIGSDKGCEIVIEGADPHHAELRWDAKDETWVIHDNPAPMETIVNGTSIQSKSLNEGDWLDIAGVRIRYADGWLKEISAGQPVGLRISVRNVSATAGGKKRLDNVSFEAREGEFVALLGPSGCGKSTLIQRIAGLAPFEGDIFFNGYGIQAEKNSLLPLVAYLPQSVEDTLHADMTVEEAMDDFARCHLAKDNRPDYATKLWDVDLDYSKLKSTPVRQFSGGMKRRFALALALLRDPQLLLLDEPTAGLDPATEASIMELLRRIADQGRTVICATHVLSCLDKCDKVVVLAPGGRLAFWGAPSASLEHFVAVDWLSVYRALDAGDWKSGDAESSSDVVPSPSDLPSAPQKASFGMFFRATFRRLWRNVCSTRNALLFFGNPIGIAIVLAWACGDMFGEKGPWETVCFCMAVAMFWMGLSGSVRSLVSERIPKRCLDLMRGVPQVSYFSAHVAFIAFSSVVQSSLFVIPVFLWRQDTTYFSWWSFPMFLAVLVVTCFAGGCVGLAVSAWAKKEIQAVGALPFVAILALFLSKPVLNTGEHDGSENEKVNMALTVSSWTMPTIHAQECLDAKLERHRTGSNNVRPEVKSDREREYTSKYIKFLLVPGIAYPLLFLPLAFLLQKRREEKWDGR